MAPSTPTTAATAGRVVHGRRARAAGRSPSRRGPTRSPRGATSSAQGRRRAGGPRRRADRGRAPADAAAARPRRRRRAPARARASVVADDRDRRQRAAAALTPSWPRSADRHPDRGDPTIGGPFELDVDRERAASAPGTSCSRARGAASTGVAEQLPRARRARLRRRLPAADPPDRRDEPQGPQQLARRRGRGDPGVPWAIGARTAATTRCTPTSARSTTSTRSSPRRASTASTSRSTSRSSARADHPWLTEHPEWFHRRPDGTLKYAENPPKKYQDIYNVNLDSRGLARRSGRRCRDASSSGSSTACASSASTTRTPSRSPFWEWLIGEVRDEHPDVVFLAEAFTEPAMMRAARQARLQPVLHVLHLEDSPLRARRVRASSWRRPAMRGVLPAELLRQHARHPPRVARRRRSGRRSTRGSSSPATLSPELRHLLRLRALRERAGPRRAARSTSTPRSTRSSSAALDGPLLPADRRGSTRSAATTPRCSTSTTSASSTPANDAPDRLRQAPRATT